MSNTLTDGLENFPEDARRHIQRADGFLDLGMALDARAELDQIPEAFRNVAPVRVELLRLAFTEKDWPAAAALAGELSGKFPDEPAFWVERAYATRRAVSIAAARDILTDAALRFPKLAMIHFNLACYDCQLGNLDSALRWLAQAVALDEKCHEAALEDEDLKPLWEKIG